MIAVSNTSPISSLIQIGLLTLVEKLFTELYIPLSSPPNSTMASSSSETVLRHALELAGESPPPESR